MRPKIFISDKVPGDADATGPGTALCEQLRESESDPVRTVRPAAVLLLTLSYECRQNLHMVTLS